MNKKVFIYPFVLTIVVFGLLAYFYPKIKIRNFKTAKPSTELLENSGYSKKETEEIVAILKAQKDVEMNNILRILKISENECEVQTGYQYSPLSGEGKSYYFKKIDGRWIYQREGRWIS